MIVVESEARVPSLPTPVDAATAVRRYLTRRGIMPTSDPRTAHEAPGGIVVYRVPVEPTTVPGTPSSSLRDSTPVEELFVILGHGPSAHFPVDWYGSAVEEDSAGRVALRHYLGIMKEIQVAEAG
jgi:hypothetical protein